jgi:hypothetical protein
MPYPNDIHYKEIIELFKESAEYYKNYIESILVNFKRGMKRIGRRIDSEIPDAKIEDLDIYTMSLFKRILSLPKGVDMWRITINSLPNEIEGFVIIINKLGDSEPNFNEPIEFENLMDFNNWIITFADIQLGKENPFSGSSYYTDFQDDKNRYVLLTPLNFSAIFGTTIFRGPMFSALIRELIFSDFDSAEFISSKLGSGFHKQNIDSEKYFSMISLLDDNLDSKDNLNKLSSKVTKILDESKLIDLVPEKINKRIEAIRKVVILSLVEKDLSLMVNTYLALTFEDAVTEAFDNTLDNSIDIKIKDGKVFTISNPSHESIKRFIKSNKLTKKKPMINNCIFPTDFGKFGKIISYLAVQRKISYSLAIELEYWRTIRNYLAHYRGHSILTLMGRDFPSSCDLINRLFAEINGYRVTK